jgi:hypothetical protein
VFELLKETVRLTVRLQEAEMRPIANVRYAHPGEAGWPEAHFGRSVVSSAPEREEELREMLLEAHRQLMRRDEELEDLAHDLQAGLAASRPDAPEGGDPAAGEPDSVPGRYLRYRRLVRRIGRVAQRELPPGATVVVVSRGDEALLDLGDGRRGWHFPQGEGGIYAGHYPTDGAEAVSHLEEIRARGGEFLLFPETSLWWLRHYQEFREHLEKRYRPVVREEGTCLIFDLGGSPETADRVTPGQ